MSLSYLILINSYKTEVFMFYYVLSFCTIQRNISKQIRNLIKNQEHFSESVNKQFTTRGEKCIVCIFFVVLYFWLEVWYVCCQCCVFLLQHNSCRQQFNFSFKPRPHQLLDCSNKKGTAKANLSEIKLICGRDCKMIWAARSVGQSRLKPFNGTAEHIYYWTRCSFQSSVPVGPS